MKSCNIAVSIEGCKDITIKIKIPTQNFRNYAGIFVDSAAWQAVVCK
jgi:hypothetical protein